MARIISIGQRKYKHKWWFVVRWAVDPGENFREFLTRMKAACPARYRRWLQDKREWWFIADDHREHMLIELFSNGEEIIRKFKAHE